MILNLSAGALAFVLVVGYITLIFAYLTVEACLTLLR